MRNQISILSCMLLIGILSCVHGGAPKPFESKYGEKFMGRKIVEAPGNITRSTFPGEKDQRNGAKIVQQSRSRSISNSTREEEELTVLSCATGNPIDDCWRCDPNWERNRKRLADCGIGFGKDAIGGKNGKFYVVTDAGDDAVNPSHGTLRHAVIQTEPLWIIFQNDMLIQLREELVINSFKTIDGRGANVHIGKGPCITIKDVTNIIIHGINIHECKRLRNSMVNTFPLNRKINHGDGISISTARHIWVDHCSMSNCEDGLIDAIKSSTYITISNNYFTRHNKVMLLGHSDDHHHDKVMQATVALNHFGKGLVQRMPRCRFGYFHVFNNDYTEWGMYAIGGSSNPTILSQGNRFMASANPLAKEVTKRQNATESEWKKWNWISEDDMLLNGAYFTPSGSQVLSTYATAYSGRPKSSAVVEEITRNAGVLSCKKGTRC